MVLKLMNKNDIRLSTCNNQYLLNLLKNLKFTKLFQGRTERIPTLCHLRMDPSSLLEGGFFSKGH